MRTILAPGIETREIDKSAYSNPMIGTNCYVLGFAEKGEPCVPMSFISKIAWQSYYGTPKTEEERYFYNACAEVLNQGGKLYCSKLPYDNESLEKIPCVKYTASYDENEQLSNVFNEIRYPGIRKFGEILDYDSLSDTCFDVLNPIFQDFKSYDLYPNHNLSDFLNVNPVTQSWLSGNPMLGGHNDQTLYQHLSYFVIHDHYESPLFEKIDTFLSVMHPCSNTCGWEWNCTMSATNMDVTLSQYFDGLNLLGKFVQNLTSGNNGNLLFKTILNEMIFALSNSRPSTEDLSTMSTHDYPTELNLTSLNDLMEIHRERNEDIYWDFKREYDDHPNYRAWADKVLSPEFFNWFKNTNNLFEGLGIDSIEDIFIKKILTPIQDKPLSDEISDEYSVSISTVYQKQLDEIFPEIAHNPPLCSINFYSYPISNVLSNNILTSEPIINPDDPVISQIYELFPIAHNDEDNSYTMNCLKIEQKSAGYDSLEKLEAYKTGEIQPKLGEFIIYDKTNSVYSKIQEDERKGINRELIGIVPIVVAGTNALYSQHFLDVKHNVNGIKCFESLCGDIMTTLSDDNNKHREDGKPKDLLYSDMAYPINLEAFSEMNPQLPTTFSGSIPDTMCLNANTFIPALQWDSKGKYLESEALKNITVLVYKLYLDSSEGNKISWEPVEAFSGSLLKSGKDINTGKSIFIDKIVNENSKYIYLFSNINEDDIKNTNISWKVPSIGSILGFYSYMKDRKISMKKSILEGLSKSFEKMSNININDLDIVCDAGVTNIANYIKQYGEEFPDESKFEYNVLGKEGWKLEKKSDVDGWKTIAFKFDDFCKLTRKDCMFITDCPRQVVLNGQQKIVRETKPESNIDLDIIPNLKYIIGLNTNYSAGYMGWVKIIDEFSGDTFWCPPSIKAMGAYINTDINYNYWDAPAGLNRGIIQALDVAFNPDIKQAGAIYEKNWNYSCFYADDGICLEGQKTFQVKPSAFDRVNVRRLFLRLERSTYKVARRQFLYEPNNAYTRQKLVDAVDPFFREIKAKGGIYDYQLICNETNNTPETIDKNELHFTAAIKPTKTIEFITLEFVCLATGGSFEEVLS